MIETCFSKTVGEIREILYQDQFLEAEKECRLMLSQDPYREEAMVLLGDIYYFQEQLEEAYTVYAYILSHNKTDYAALANFGKVLLGQRNYSEAEKIFEFLVQKFPYDARLHYHRALTMLTQGNYQQGFEEYKWRWILAGEPHKMYRGEWDIQTNLEGKRVAICYEQGFGDVFQFIRYAQLLKMMGVTIFLVVPEKLIPILSQCSYIDEIFSEHLQLPPVDFKIYFMDLPCAFKTTVETIQAPIPYLYADQNLVREWKEKLSFDNNFKVGLCWEGKIHDQSFHMRYYSRKRSILFEQLISLSKISGVSFYSLQKVDNPQALTSSDQFMVHDFGPDFDGNHGSFMDTAAVMKNLDLIISIDTSVVHLAGGLGVPVWILLPYEADWRWLLNRDDSPWYPTMKLFRQQKPNEWHEVIEEVCHALEEMVQKGKK